jgi:antibiotic biosynthesis monooxygenase (ABM) superfamily enzyme
MEGNMKAPVLYMVKFWVSPDEGRPFISWLKGGHIAQVIQAPGFLWARHYRLDGVNEVGWEGYITIYGLDSTNSLKLYFESPKRKYFLQESEQFKDFFKAERFYGVLDFNIASPNQKGDEDCKVIYCEQFSVAPRSRQAYLEWLNNNHIPEVITQPGFVRAFRVHLDEHDKDGWDRYMIFYGQSTHGMLEKYLNNLANKQFSLQREPLTKDLRMGEFFGSIELALDNEHYLKSKL